MSIERTLVLPTHQEAFKSTLPVPIIPKNQIEAIQNPLRAELKINNVSGWALRCLGTGLVIYGLYQLTQEHYLTAAICIIGGYLVYKKGSQLLKKK